MGPSDACQRLGSGAGAAPRKGLKERADAWARRQAPLRDITAAQKHVSLSNDRMKSLRMVR